MTKEQIIRKMELDSEVMSLGMKIHKFIVDCGTIEKATITITIRGGIEFALKTHKHLVTPCPSTPPAPR